MLSEIAVVIKALYRNANFYKVSIRKYEYLQTDKEYSKYKTAVLFPCFLIPFSCCRQFVYSTLLFSRCYFNPPWKDF
jgi:hypothetical protein